MAEKFTTKERKKEFDKLYKKSILPFLEGAGFKQVTITSKRVFREFQLGLSVYIYFEYINFGSGFYRINIVFYDDDFGSENDDGMYIAAASIRRPEIRGNDVDELSASVEQWKDEMNAKVFSFIDHHSTHHALLNSQELHITPGVEDLLQRKSR